MKATIELPDELYRAVKIRAAHENRKLKDLLAEIIARGLAGGTDGVAVRPLPKPVKLRGGALTLGEIESGIARGRG